MQEHRDTIVRVEAVPRGYHRSGISWRFRVCIGSPIASEQRGRVYPRLANAKPGREFIVTLWILQNESCWEALSSMQPRTQSVLLLPVPISDCNISQVSHLS